MANKILGVLIDVENEVVKAVEIEDTLDEYYKILNCDCIDIVRRYIGRNLQKRFDIVCDDERLFKDPHKISAIDGNGNVQLIGNIFIVNPPADGDVDGKLQSLSEYDVSYILGKVQKIPTRNFEKGYPMLTQCEY